MKDQGLSRLAHGSMRSGDYPEMNDTRFAGMHVLITGGGSGIGQAAALALLRKVQILFS